MAAGTGNAGWNRQPGAGDAFIVPARAVSAGRYDPRTNVLGGTMRHTTTIATLAAALALALAGCGGQDDTKAKPAPSASSEPASPTPDAVDQLIKWRDGGGSETLDTFLKDLTVVDEASDPVDLGVLRDACADLAAHVETAQLEDPIPDEAANNSWKLALGHLAASATACIHSKPFDFQRREGRGAGRTIHITA